MANSCCTTTTQVWERKMLTISILNDAARAVYYYKTMFGRGGGVMPLGVDIYPPREVQPSRRSATGKIRVAAGSKTRALIPCMLEY
jgi:hypothetical protein